MKLRLVFLGKTRGTECRALIDDYVARIRHFNPVEVAERKSTHAGPEVLEEERAKAGRSVSVVLLDATGKNFTSEEFSVWLQRQLNSGKPELIFLLGGAEGFSEETKSAATELLSLSQMTLPHELARVVLTEQLYRGFSILNNHPYSK